MNIPFEWDGATTQGVDCVGLLILFYKQEFDIEIPHLEYSRDRLDPENYFAKYYEQCGFVHTTTPKYGDVVTFNNAKKVERHCAIILSESQALHADKFGSSVINYAFDLRWIAKTGRFYTHRNRK